MALRCFVCVENNSLVEKRPNHREIIDFEYDFSTLNFSNIMHVVSHLGSDSRLSTWNSEEPKGLMNLDGISGRVPKSLNRNSKR